MAMSTAKLPTRSWHDDGRFRCERLRLVEGAPPPGLAAAGAPLQARARVLPRGVARARGVSAAKPACSKTSTQRSQLLGNSHNPWMNTTGVFPRVSPLDLLGLAGGDRSNLRGNRGHVRSSVAAAWAHALGRANAKQPQVTAKIEPPANRPAHSVPRLPAAGSGGASTTHRWHDRPAPLARRGTTVVWAEFARRVHRTTDKCHARATALPLRRA
jgi:hypothetical protein